MTDYHFTGAYPRVLTGLSNGVNAIVLHAADPAEPGDAPIAAETPYGATIVAYPGDAIQTNEPYEHPELEEVTAEAPPTNADGSPIPTPKPPKPSRTTTPAPADPTEN